MMFEDMQFDGADSRAITWGDEVPADVEGGIAGRRDRLRRVGHPRRHPPDAGGPAVHDRREERRARAARGGRTAIRAHASTSAATSTATRSSPPTTGASTTASSPSCATTSRDVVEKYELRPHCRFGTTVTARHVGRATRALAGRRRATPTATDEVIDARFVISAVGSLNLPQHARHPRHGRRSPGRRSTRRAGPTTSTSPGTRFALDRRRRERVPDRADDRRRGRAARRSSSAPRSGCSRTRCTTRRCPPVTGGRCATCRSTPAGSGS